MRPPRSKLQICDFSQSLGLTNVSADTTAGEKEEELLILKTYLREM